MSRYRTSEVMVEMSEFAMDLIQEASKLISYHRACVYKQETTTKINFIVDQIRVVVRVINDDLLSDLMADFDAVQENSGQFLAPGESTLSWRVAKLSHEFVPAIAEFRRRMQRKRSMLSDEQQAALIANRRSLLAVCKQGSRSWELLKNM